MTDSLGDAFAEAARKETANAQRREAITRARRLRRARQDAIRAENTFRHYDALMRQRPGR